MSQGPGEGEVQGGFSLEDLPTGSVVYVSRGSFRMEAVGDGEAEGVVQAVARVATAPYHGGGTGENTGVDRLPVSATFHAPDLPSLFGTDGEVPILAAPTTRPTARTRTGDLSRAALATLAALGVVVFACGVLFGAVAMRPARPAAPMPSVAVAPVAPVAPVTLVQIAAPAEPAPAIIPLPAPVTITARKKVVARHVDAAPAAPAAPKLWVDPFAE
jgi:hypothetical protein